MTTRSVETKTRLLEATMDTIRMDGLVKVSARTVADRAGLAQGLIFYHFGTVSDLIAAACLSATQERVERHADQFAAVTSLTDLIDLGVAIHIEEAAAGHVDVLSHVLAASHHDPAMAQAAKAALDLWRPALESAVERALNSSPLAGVIAPPEVTGLILAAFVGFELTEPVTEQGVVGALATLRELTAALDGLGPVARRAIRAGLPRVVHSTQAPRTKGSHASTNSSGASTAGE